MKNDKVVDILIGKAETARDLVNIVQGLVIAQIVCQRHLHVAFDKGNNSHQTVLDIMGEIVETIDHLREQADDKE